MKKEVLLRLQHEAKLRYLFPVAARRSRIKQPIKSPTMTNTEQKVKEICQKYLDWQLDNFPDDFDDWAATPQAAVLLSGEDWVSAVKNFHVAMEVPYFHEPTNISNDRKQLRSDILQEEVDELKSALLNNDITGTADAICDCIYVLIGTSWEVGLGAKLNEMFMEVHRSNMSKLHNGKAIKREDGKVIKSPNYSSPDLNSIIESFHSRTP